jgi:hypothetical protein
VDEVTLFENSKSRPLFAAGVESRLPLIAEKKNREDDLIVHDQKTFALFLQLSQLNPGARCANALFTTPEQLHKDPCEVDEGVDDLEQHAAPPRPLVLARLQSAIQSKQSKL